ncbi:MAG: helix-turn-helix domain-containing protein [Paludibacteraceae bacterium]|nr:helix-turn-helix domain-containing protein [Paludibacteraceae bacterium]
MNEQPTKRQRTMLGSFYRIDVNTCDALNLWGREAMVYSALLYLCKAAPYKGSATELANFSRCGDSTTALRMLWSLEEKGLISRTKEGISILQNAEETLQNAVQPLQNAAVSVQNAAILRERTKENIKENNKESVGDNMHTRTLVFDKNKIFEPPIWKDWEAFAREHKIELLVYQKAWCYYMMRGWKDVQDWKAALMYWDLKNKT